MLSIVSAVLDCFEQAEPRALARPGDAPTSSSPTPAAEIPLAVLLSSDHPRARSGACCNPCEPSFVLPLSVGSLLH